MQDVAMGTFVVQCVQG